MQTTEMNEGYELLSLEEAAEFLCVSKSTMYRLLDQRKLAGMKAGKQWRFRREDLLAYMRRGPAAQALANVPMAMLDVELDFLAAELQKAGSSTAESDDPTLEGEAGKITQLVRRMVWLLYALRASDLHLNPAWTSNGAAVQMFYRVDGALREVRQLPMALHEALMLEWKRLAEMAIETSDRPQEGPVRLVYGQKRAAVRVAVLPTIYGEKLTVRAIPTKVPTMELLEITHTPLPEWTRRQRGLILFVGPTGSGKSTTLSAFLLEIINTRARNVFSVVDPIEYEFPHGVNHVKVRGFGVAEGLRAVRYHDPDIITVGEFTGDPEEAELTVNLAETGHLMMTTMHASDTISPLYAYLDAGVKRLLLANNMIGVCLQTLEPKPCPACMAPVAVEPGTREHIRHAAACGGYLLPDDAVFRNPAGCDACEGRGYRGRTALHEFLTFTPAVRAAFLHGATPEEFEAAVRALGQLSYFAAQVKRAVEGTLALDSVLKFLPMAG
ncbi:MAG: putative type II secretion system protein E [bacterium ADurb.Bin429]|nr:MAG: putative type II secretion system protein E [bacterium ADurb.Bin429]